MRPTPSVIVYVHVCLTIVALYPAEIHTFVPKRIKHAPSLSPRTLAPPPKKLEKEGASSFLIVAHSRTHESLHHIISKPSSALTEEFEASLTSQ